MRLAVRVGLAFVLSATFLAVLVVLTGGGVDAFVTLVLLALLLLRALPGAQAPRDLRARMGVFLFLGTLAFAFLLVQRVRGILNL